MNLKTTSIGFIGLGNLGSAICERLITCGYSLHIKDPNLQRVSVLENLGAKSASTQLDFQPLNFILICVPGDKELLDVVLNDEYALLKVLRPRAMVIVISTVMPATIMLLKKLCGEKQILLIDSPVSGGPYRALNGDLTIMVGGNQGELELCMPILSAIGSNVHLVGESGAGQVVKFSNQLVMFATLSALYEAGDYAKKFGLEIEILLKVFKTTTADSWVVQNWGFFQKIAADYDANGTLLSMRPWVKDLNELLESADEVGADLQLAEFLSRTVALQIEKSK